MTSRISVSCSKNQAEEIRRTARKKYPHSTNCISKFMLNIFAKQQSKKPQQELQTEQLEILGKMLIQLQGLSRNINQQTKRLNQGELVNLLNQDREKIIRLTDQIEEKLKNEL